jgi:hypothetical protein
MIARVFVCFFVVAATHSIAANRAISDAATPEAEAHILVDKALLAEAAGDVTQRDAHLAEAVRIAPDDQSARWHSGQVRTNGKWQPIAEAQRAAANDPRRAEYEVLRDANSQSLEGQLGLARWCRANGLEDEARYHWTTVLSYEPQNTEALHALKARWFDGRLMGYEEIASAKARAREQRHAARKYAAQVSRWKRLLSAGDLLSQRQAINEIRALRDANALPALEEVTLDQKLTTGAEFERSMQIGLALVDALVTMPGPKATESLLRHAGMSQISDVRSAAIEALKQRPQQDYVPHLLGALTSPIESSFRVVTDSDGSVHYWHSLYRQGKDADWILENRSSMFQHDFGGSTIVFDDATGTVVSEDRESDASVAAKKAFVATRSQADFAGRASTVQQEIGRMNEQVAAANARIFPILREVTGQDLGTEPKAWWDWWDSSNDYYSYGEGERPKYEQYYVENKAQYYREPEYVSVSARHSCFAAGTMVWTKTGLRAIETIEIGDFVLAQDPTTGELAYKPVMGRTLRPGRKTVYVRAGNDVLQATLGHPMWVSGTGWKMAKELKPGDVLHGAKGPALVDSIEPADTIEVYNLIVVDWHNFFVGESGVLVHDNSPRNPVATIVPGLAVNKVR